MVLVEPLLASLEARFPRARVVLLASDRFAEVHSSQGREVLAVPKALMARKPWLFPGFVTRLRSCGFEVALDASHPHSFSLSGAAAAALSGAPSRIGFPSAEAGDWYTLVVPPPGAPEHESRILHSLGSVWDDWPGWRPPRLSAGSAGSRGAIGLHVGASRDKGLPVDLLACIVSELSRMGRGLEIYWSGAGERSMAVEVSRAGGAVMPGLDLRGLMDALAGLDALVTADNGPMHLASALGIPVVAMFRVDNRTRFRPLSPGSEALLVQDGLDPSEVVRSVASALRRGGQSSSSSSSSSSPSSPESSGRSPSGSPPRS